MRCRLKRMTPRRNACISPLVLDHNTRTTTGGMAVPMMLLDMPQMTNAQHVWGVMRIIKTSPTVLVHNNGTTMGGIDILVMALDMPQMTDAQRAIMRIINALPITTVMPTRGMGRLNRKSRVEEVIKRIPRVVFRVIYNRMSHRVFRYAPTSC